jgi:hypothetical protein
LIKKILLGLLLLILIIVAGFVAIGFIVPNIRYTTTAVINKPRDFVWTILTDKSKTKD